VESVDSHRFYVFVSLFLRSYCRPFSCRLIIQIIWNLGFAIVFWKEFNIDFVVQTFLFKNAHRLSLILEGVTSSQGGLQQREMSCSRSGVLAASD
jgi:hypothetical protein